jgi:general secretion pathway protein A
MYLEFYKLRQAPFQLTPDFHFVQLLDPHRDALRAISQVVAQRKGFMVLTGAVGTGKTTLLNAMLSWFSHVRPRIATAFIVNPLLTRDEFLETVLDEFDVRCAESSKPKRLAALHEHLLQIKKEQGTCVLIVDEAHLLTVDVLEEIRLLGNMETPQGKLMQVVLCGQPELAEVLLRPALRALRQRIAVMAQLRPLTAQQAANYIVQRLNTAGLSGPMPFTTASLTSVYHSTKGVPRLINLLCDTCLQVGYELKETAINPAIVHEASSRLAALESALGTAELPMERGEPPADDRPRDPLTSDTPPQRQTTGVRRQ